MSVGLAADPASSLALIITSQVPHPTPPETPEARPSRHANRLNGVLFRLKIRTSYRRAVVLHQQSQFEQHISPLTLAPTRFFHHVYIFQTQQPSKTWLLILSLVKFHIITSKSPINRIDSWRFLYENRASKYVGLEPFFTLGIMAAVYQGDRTLPPNQNATALTPNVRSSIGKSNHGKAHGNRSGSCLHEVTNFPLQPAAKRPEDRLTPAVDDSTGNFAAELWSKMPVLDPVADGPPVRVRTPLSILSSAVTEVIFASALARADVFFSRIIEMQPLYVSRRDKA
ncbi:uncharacterized protein CLUP02_06582 [Colletotrichum lupini]|uniref:Uncharacterized protein n=1 Tax=Colletotrichum lupini TaxID=145971 RepID=A0A9Q8WF91_9PEZI|nr:uncharacterized protein CLUP02_06582 [Colletotrichum lupini]UQC81096.1 hypothetical protein CLUP02_06582 [Colletotrichum lupini]